MSWEPIEEAVRVWAGLVASDAAYPVSHLGKTVCAGCGVPVMSTEEQQDSARCIDCGREGQGIDWPASGMVGEWHPTVGDALVRTASTRVMPAPADPSAPTVGRACCRCLMPGDAIDADHAVAMLRGHEMYACPMPEYGISDDERWLRIQRRNALARIRPDVPPVPALEWERVYYRKPSGEHAVKMVLVHR